MGQQPLSRGAVTNVTRFSEAETPWARASRALPRLHPARERGLGTASHVVPLRLARGRNQTHRALGQCGDGQARIDSEITRQNRAVADVHIAIAKDPMAMIDDAVLR